MSEIISINLAANESKRFELTGRYFEIIDSAAAISIDFYAPNGGILDSIQGALSGIYFESPFSAMIISNGATAQTVQILIMAVGRGGSRRQPGIVNVVDGERQKVLLGYPFRTVVAPTGGGAGGVVGQLWNSAGSGRNLFVNSAIFSADANTAYNIQTTTTQAPNLGSTPAYSMDTSGANGTGTARFGNDATVYVASRSVCIGFLVANTERELVLRRPILLRPGQGLNVLALTTTVALRVGFDFEEWPL